MARRLAKIPTGHPLAHILDGITTVSAERLDELFGRLQPDEPIVVVDLFCGAGGTSAGVVRALRALSRRVLLYCVNHWDLAIESHRLNFPDAIHVNASLENVLPSEVLGNIKKVHLLTASPECIQFSTARGNRAILDQSRSSAAYVLQWLADPEIIVEKFILENVVQWKTWGRLDPATRRPIPEFKGEYYHAFLGALRKRGYRVIDGTENAADHGDATSRRRLFVLGTLGTDALAFPARTYAKDPTEHPGKGLKKWRAAREILETGVKGNCIFTRPEGPHAPNSLQRMLAGYTMQHTIPLARAYAASIESFIPISEQYHRMVPPRSDEIDEEHLDVYLGETGLRSLTEVFDHYRTLHGIPSSGLPWTTAERKIMRGNALNLANALVEKKFADPVIRFTLAELLANHNDVEEFVVANRMHSAPQLASDGPIHAASGAHGGGIAHVSQLLLGQHGGGVTRLADMDTVPTIATGGAIGLADGALLRMNHSASSQFGNGIYSLDEPKSAIVTKDCTGLMQSSEPQPFIISINHANTDGSTHDSRVNDCSRPINSITTKNGSGLVDSQQPKVVKKPGSFVLAVGHGTMSADEHATRINLGDKPLGSVTAGGNQFGFSTPEPYITRMNGFFGEIAPTRCIESVDEPVSNIVAGGTHHGLVHSTDPFLVPQDSYGVEMPVLPTTEPVPAIRTISRIGLTQGRFPEAFLLNRGSGENRAALADQEPMFTATCSGAGYLVQSGSEIGVQSTDPFIYTNFGERSNQEPRVHSIDKPVMTITPRAGCVVDAKLAKQFERLPYFEIEEFPGVRYYISVTFRMLLTVELARATSLIDEEHDYKFVFAGSTQQITRQIGNAVPVRLVMALVTAQMSKYARKGRRGKVIQRMTAPPTRRAA